MPVPVAMFSLMFPIWESESPARKISSAGLMIQSATAPASVGAVFRLHSMNAFASSIDTLRTDDSSAAYSSISVPVSDFNSSFNR